MKMENSQWKSAYTYSELSVNITTTTIQYTLKSKTLILSSNNH